MAEKRQVRRGRCAVHYGLHDEIDECRRFIDVEFVKALGLKDPDDG